MYTIKTITLELPELGSEVQLRELTADEFFEVNEQSIQATDERGSQYLWLSKMLWVDGVQFPAEEIRQWGASLTVPMLTRMRELFPKTFMDDDEATDEAAPQDPNG